MQSKFVVVLAGVTFILALSAGSCGGSDSNSEITNIEVQVDEAQEITLAGNENWEFEDNTVDIGTDAAGRQLRLCIPPCQVSGRGINLQVSK